MTQVWNIPYVHFMDLSRDGRTAAVLTNETGSLQLAALPMRRGASLRPLSHGTDRVSSARISNDSQTVAFARDFGGREEHQLFRVPLAGGREEQIARLPPVRIFDLNWSRADDLLACSGATREFNGIWFLDPRSGVFRDVYRGRHWTFGPSWSADDARLGFSAKTTEAPTASELVFLDGQGKGEPVMYTPKTGSENSDLHWHPKEPLALFRTDARGRYELATYDVEAQRLEYLTAGERDLGLDFPVFDWTPDGDAVYYLATREGRTRLYVETLDGSEPPTEVPIPRGYHATNGTLGLKMAATGRFVAFAWSSLGRPHAVSRRDLRTRKTVHVHEQRTRVPLGMAEPVVYRSFDGLPIHGWFVRPPGPRRRRPTVLWIHGGPAWEVADEWNAAIQSFAVAGYPVFAPNIRGSTGYGVEFQNRNIHDVGGGDLRDVEEAAKYLSTRPDVDPRKIAIVGASYGGFMTFLSMTKLPDLWAAGVAIVGITDWKEMYDLSDAAFRSFIERYLGRPEENPDLYRDRSPIHFVENLRAPLLIWHRGNDSRCPLQPVEKFANRLRELGRRFEMQVVWDEGHGMQKTENLVRQYQAAVAFLRRELGDGEAVTPPRSGTVRGPRRSRRTG